MKALFLCLIITLSFTPAMAQAPIPSAHPVQEVEKKLKGTKAEKEKLQTELKNIKKSLSEKREELVSIASKIKKNEQNLTRLENDISKQEAEQKKIEDKLIDDKKSISDLLLALQRIRRIPPEAVLARPESPLKTAQSSMLLESILPRIHKRADNLKKDLEKLEILIGNLKQDKEKALKLSEKLKEDEKSLSTLLKKREKIYANTEKNIKQQQAELTKISLQARNLKDLVKKIEEKKRLEKEQQKRIQKEKNTKTTFKNTPIPRAGRAQLPATGIIKVSYGKTDEIGAVSQGLKIKTRPSALIVAPMGGIVDYAGKFKGYGQIIILKHQKGYHSLIAGLDKIDTVVGRSVTTGEPVGRMSNATDDEDAQLLYYELRHKGHPVNPSKKIPGLR